MLEAHWVWYDASMADVIDDLTSNNWDHVFVINHEGAPQGRIHAVDVLKIIARKKVNRDIAWMHGIPAQQLVNLPPITVTQTTPLLKAGALMLTHDLNQIAVVNKEGKPCGRCRPPNHGSAYAEVHPVIKCPSSVLLELALLAKSEQWSLSSTKRQPKSTGLSGLQAPYRR